MVFEAIAELVAAAGETPIILGGLTPNELRLGLAAGAAAVQVFPTEALGTALAHSLPGLLAPGGLIAAGRMEHYQAELWLSAGAIAVWPTNVLTPEVLHGESLDAVRVALAKWRTVL